jgi:regulatory protein
MPRARPSKVARLASSRGVDLTRGKLTPEVLARLPPEGAALVTAIRLLRHRDRSSAELEEGLAAKGFAGDAAAQALAVLRRSRLVDDERLAESETHRGLARRGVGRRKVERELAQRGVEPAAARAGVERALQDLSESETLESLAERYWQRHGTEEPRQRIRKLAVWLVRRGFAPGLVAERLARRWPEHAEAIEGLAERGEEVEE